VRKHVDLQAGAVVWVNFDPTRGSEQAGHRPAVVVASNSYLAAIPNVVIVLPVTTRDRAFPHHIRLDGDTGLSESSFAMTEQPRTIDRARISTRAGQVSPQTLTQLRTCLRRFLDL
jgi:mRNA interferase MazF